MTRHFEDELAQFKEILLTMGSYAERSVSQAIQAMTDRNDPLAVQVQENDDIMDHLEMEIDEMAINLLSKAPLGTDLRLITVTMKISQNLERIGDEATTIARRALELNTEPQLKAFIDIPRMAGIALGMLKESLDAFVNKETEKARAIVPRDKEVDALNRQLYRE
jgi:phosphate transport system protein